MKEKSMKRWSLAIAITIALLPGNYACQMITGGGQQAGQSANVDRLLLDLKSPDAGVRLNAISVLASLKDPRATDPLCNIVLSDSNEQVRQKAIELLGSM